MHIKRTICLVLLFLFFASTALGASPEVYTHSGEIAAIDLQHGTVVVEVPVEQGALTVGGPLIPAATLRKGEQRARLDDFSVGEQVQISWEKTDETLLIHRLVASK